MTDQGTTGAVVRRSVAQLLATLAVCALASCSDDESGSSDSRAAASTTDTPAAAPTADPTKVQPPVRPGAAHGLSLAAGTAFVRYYTDLLNYSSETGDTRPMLAESDPGCRRCRLYADFVVRTNARNNGLVGDYRERIGEPKLKLGTTGRLGGSVTVAVGAYSSKATGDSEAVSHRPETFVRQFALSPVAGRWIMYEMKLIRQ
nr:DUF6318 family protein [Kribbella amoyensis]